MPLKYLSIRRIASHLCHASADWKPTWMACQSRHFSQLKPSLHLCGVEWHVNFTGPEDRAGWRQTRRWHARRPVTQRLTGHAPFARLSNSLAQFDKVIIYANFPDSYDKIEASVSRGGPDSFGDQLFWGTNKNFHTICIKKAKALAWFFLLCWPGQR